MTEDKEKDSGYDGQGLKGPLYWLAGTATAAAAKALSGPGGLLGGLFGGGYPPPGGPGAPVSREILDLTTENSMLKANAHADRMNADQAVWNAVQQGRIDCQQRQIDQLFTLTRLVVPNGNLNPGVGPVAVVPVPPPAAATAPDAATVSAIVQAVLTAQKDASSD